MLVAVVVAFVIIVVASAIPGIHLVATIPIAPFVAGFVGAGTGKLVTWQLPTFGLIVSGLALIPLIALIIVAFLTDAPIWNIRSDWLFVFVAVLFVPYVWFGLTFGAFLSYYLRRRQSKNNPKS